MSIPFVESYSKFGEYLRSNKYIVVNFTASWCGPCQAIKPKIDELYNDPKYKHIQIMRADLDSQQELASAYKVLSVPTFVFIANEVEVNRVVGANLEAIYAAMDLLSVGSKQNGGKRTVVEPRSTSGVSWIESLTAIPPVTRFFTITTVLVCIADSLHWIPRSEFMCELLLYDSGIRHIWHVWQVGTIYDILNAILALLLQCYRFFTAFLVPSGLLYNQPLLAIMDIYFFYTFANHLESYQGKFKRNFPDCLWFTLTTGTMIVLSTFAYSVYDANHIPHHHQMMLSCVTYLWSRGSKNSIIRFLGLVPIKAYYLPIFNLFFKLVGEGRSSFIDSFIGILGGYLYQCLASGTVPIYNLFPGAYNQGRSVNNGNRVGYTGASNDPGFLSDAIFDKGYLKAPIWLYKLLNYPINNSKRTTAFTLTFTSKASEKSHSYTSGNDWSSHNEGAFQGKGYRLGD